MRKVEIFSSGHYGQLRDEINQWFTEHPKAIVEGRTQSEVVLDGRMYLTISIFYNEVSDGD